jgi:hypothetical protein
MLELANEDINTVTITILHKLKKLNRDLEDIKTPKSNLEMKTIMAESLKKTDVTSGSDFVGQALYYVYNQSHHRTRGTEKKYLMKQ